MAVAEWQYRAGESMRHGYGNPFCGELDAMGSALTAQKYCIAAQSVDGLVVPCSKKAGYFSGTGFVITLANNDFRMHRVPIDAA
jgi:hypothetical protein